MEMVRLDQPVVGGEEVDLQEFEVGKAERGPVGDEVDADDAVGLLVSLGHAVGPPAGAGADVEHAGVAIDAG